MLTFPRTVVSRRRDTDATRFCDALKPRRDIYAVAKNVMRLNNHVADVDADTERKSSVFRIGCCKFFVGYRR